MSALPGRMGTLALSLVLAACAATPPPPATLVSIPVFGQTVIPGKTSKAELLATLGHTRTVMFDSGYQAWLYLAPAGRDRYTEFVVLLGPDGIVRKTRRRDP